MRKAAREALNEVVLKNDHHPFFLREAVILAFGLIKDATNPNNHIQRASSSAVVAMIYDKESLKSTEDPLIAWLHEFGCRFLRAAMPGAHLVEIFTWMRHIPSRKAISLRIYFLYTDILKQICGMEA